SGVGGITVAGLYTVASVTDANTIVFTAAQTATSTPGAQPLTANTIVSLAPGQADGLGGLGFGTGGYGSGGYGGAASGYTLYPRTWSFASWGQNLVANPRGGGIYEWAPNTSAPELVTNGDFASGSGWTPGTGWAIGGGIATGSVTVGTLTTTVTLPI